jgi:hypothetical protein
MGYEGDVNKMAAGAQAEFVRWMISKDTAALDHFHLQHPHQPQMLHHTQLLTPRKLKVDMNME